MSARIVDDAMVERAIAGMDACHFRAYAEKQTLGCQSRPEWMRAALEAAFNDSAVAELVADGWNMVASARHTGQPIDPERLAAALARVQGGAA